MYYQIHYQQLIQFLITIQFINIISLYFIITNQNFLLILIILLYYLPFMDLIYYINYLSIY